MAKPDVMGDVYWFNWVAGNSGGAGGIANYPMLKQATEHVEEELDELCTAREALMREYWQVESPDRAAELVENVADAALDLIYVSVNVLYALGIRDPGTLWREVHRANMAKLPDCPDCAHLGNEAPVCHTCDSMRKLPPRRRADGKILKPDGWQPPALRKHILRELFSSVIDSRPGTWHNSQSHTE